MLKNIGLWIIGIIVICLIAFLLGLFDLFSFKFFAPKYENARREVFEQTKSYNHGKIQDLSKYYLEYEYADYESKDAIKAVIQMSFSDFNADTIRNLKIRHFLINTRGY